MTERQYESLEDLGEWMSGLGFRMLVYVAILVFDLILMLYGNALYEQGLLTEGLTVMEFSLATIGIVSVLMMLSDFARGISYALIHATGRHRLYLGVAVLVAVVVGLQITSTGGDFGEFTDAYHRIVWAFSALVGFEFVRGGVYGSDVKRLRSVIGI